VLGPHDGQVFANRTQAISFIGYASKPSATLDIQCRRPGTSSWLMASTATAEAGVANLGETTPLYYFQRSVVVRSDCWLSQGEFGWQTQVRIREPGGSASTLYTFDEEGILCLNDELGEGEEWVPAGAACQTGTMLTLSANG